AFPPRQENLSDDWSDNRNKEQRSRERRRRATPLREQVMNPHNTRRQNLDHLVELAGTYRGLSRKKLAEWLGRDPTKLSPETGNPKLDYLVRLAEVLDWSVGDIAQVIWEEPPARCEEGAPPDFDAANAAAKAAHRAGDYARMLTMARAMAALASSPE